MAFDALVTNPGRLRILTALAAAVERQPFIELRRRTGLTDGNLATHARRLQSAGFIAIEKSITAGKPLTTLHLTRQGREALVDHARQLQAALEPDTNQLGAAGLLPLPDSAGDDDWVD